MASDKERVLQFVCERLQWNPETPSAYVLGWTDAIIILLRQARLEVRTACDCKGTGMQPQFEYDAASNQMEERGRKPCRGPVCKRIAELERPASTGSK